MEYPIDVRTHDSWFQEQCARGGGVFDRTSFDLLCGCLQKFKPNVNQFVDVGAHIGSWTLGMLSKYPKVEVTAIEPSLQNISEFKANLARNLWAKDRTVRIINAGASAHFQPRFEEFVADCENSGQFHVEPKGREPAVVKFTAEMIPLDEILKDYKRVDVIKIDTEGYEYQVLCGACETIAKHRPVIHLELNGLSRRYRRKEEEILGYLYGEGYEQVGQFNKDYIFCSR